MREILTRPSKLQRPIAVAIQSAPWPAWAPRPVNQQPVPPAIEPVAAEPEEASADPMQERVALCRLIGNRLREARELAGFSQQAAAELFNYSNSSKLAKVEGATDTNSVPFWLIAKAAKVYQVSADYLLGISDDWDVAPGERHQRQIGRWLLDTWQAARQQDLVALDKLNCKLSFVGSGISTLADRAESVLHAFDRLRSLNAGYDDLIAGAKLQATIEGLADAGRQARLQLRRLHLELAGEHAEALP